MTNFEKLVNIQIVRLDLYSDIDVTAEEKARDWVFDLMKAMRNAKGGEKYQKMSNEELALYCIEVFKEHDMRMNKGLKDMELYN